jgi:hypothetical protein
MYTETNLFSHAWNGSKVSRKAHYHKMDNLLF